MKTSHPEKDFSLYFFENNSIIFELFSGEDGVFKIGRNVSNDVVFSNQSNSGNHAVLNIQDGKLYLTDLGSTNGTFIDGKRLEKDQEYELLDTSEVKFGQLGLCELRFSPNKTIKQSSAQAAPQKSSKLTIGRSSDCDIILEDSTVSRFHATIEDFGNGKYELQDLQSTNGTFFNGKKILTAQLSSIDKFIIGKFLLSVDGSIARLDEQTAVKVNNASKVFRNGHIGIYPITFEIKPKTLTAIMGPSGCGKSTLLKMLNGISGHTAGKISLFDLDLVQNFDYVKRQIGYVPQDDIVHMELTVYQSIYYAAKLRLENENDQTIKHKIEKILGRLKIDKIRDNLNSEISGGQRKRVCIAIELLSDPMLLLLDEPTSPLDPQSIEEFMQILKELVVENTTIVLVTHKPEDLQFMDEVIFLAEGGYFAYKGSTKAYLEHFKVASTVEVYSELSGNNAGKWKELNTNVPLSQRDGDYSTITQQKVKWWKQLFWLTTRSIKIKTNDKLNTAILILQAPVIAFLIGLIFNEITLGVLFMMIISCIWFGVNNASREIVKEKNIFLREKLFNVRVGSYLLSKTLTLLILAIFQTGLFVLILQLNYSSNAIKLGNSVDIFGWLLLVTMVSSLLGLLVSASMKTTDKVMALVPILLIPQIMLAGVITKITSPVVEGMSYLTFSRWGTEGLGHIQQNVSVNSKELVMDSLGIPMKDVAGEIVLKDVANSHDATNLLNDQYQETYTSLFGAYSGHFILDIFFILLLGIGLYISIYMVLNRKSK